MHQTITFELHSKVEDIFFPGRIDVSETNDFHSIYYHGHV